MTADRMIDVADRPEAPHLGPIVQREELAAPQFSVMPKLLMRSAP
jgi:hypothetical protein